MTSGPTAKSGEFAIIENLFAPLTEGCHGALGLGDDVAILPSGPLVITKDVLISGVHFRKADPLNLVARKVLRVNISDLIAKGVKPEGYLIGCVWSKATDTDDIALFVSGLSDDQQTYKCRLYGGDTARHRLASAPTSFSATFFGIPSSDGIVERGGASSGDDLYVTGTIGDSGLGLMVLDNKLKLGEDEARYLGNRYHLPDPRVTFGTALNSFASASMDVSDGLIADANHLARQSGIRLEIDGARVPLSLAARAWHDQQPDSEKAIARLCSFGDDYEILFTAPVTMRRAIEMAAKASRTSVTRIGNAKRGCGVELMGESGAIITPDDPGYDHFS